MFLYIIGPLDNAISKIGFSKDVNRRLKDLQTGHPYELKVHYQYPINHDRVRLLERKIHSELSYYKTKGEWFNVSPAWANEQIKFAIIRWGEDPLLGF